MGHIELAAAEQKIILRQQALCWLGWLGSNQRNDGIKIRCLTAWRHPNIGYAVCEIYRKIPRHGTTV